MEIINLKDMILYAANFIILFVLIRIFLYKPVTKFMQKREKMVSEQLDQAANAKRDAEQLKTKYETLVAGAQSEAQEIISKSHARATAQYDQIVESAQKDSRDIMQRAMKEIETEKLAAREQMRDDITDMAVKIAGKVLEREISAEDNKHIADSFFEEVTSE